jgi:phospholipase C
MAAWPGPCGRSGAASRSYDHVIWIWMENKNLSAVLDSLQAPFMSGLADSCGTAMRYVDHGVHPSLPNYLAATSGDIQGVHDDAAPSRHPLRVDNIFRQVRAIGKTAKSYEESMPSNCALQSTRRYAVKHNPAAYYVGEADRTACQADDVPFDEFLPDLAGQLPQFSLITPDICNDMHDCSVSTGDEWLRAVVGEITSSPTYRAGRTALFIVFDESQGEGTMPFIAIAPSIVPGTRAEAELDHYSLLAFTEDALGITTRLGEAANAPSLADAFGL